MNYGVGREGMGFGVMGDIWWCLEGWGRKREWERVGKLEVESSDFGGFGIGMVAVMVVMVVLLPLGVIYPKKRNTRRTRCQNWQGKKGEKLDGVECEGMRGRSVEKQHGATLSLPIRGALSGKLRPNAGKGGLVVVTSPYKTVIRITKRKTKT